MDLSNYPYSLQLLMMTDGTVTELVKLITGEEVVVNKISEDVSKDQSLLDRKIYLSGKSSHKAWVYANSMIYLQRLPQEFVSDLLIKNVPIGTLWAKYKIETYKEITGQFAETTETESGPFELSEELLCRSYKVFNNQQVIMNITEKFPISLYQ